MMPYPGFCGGSNTAQSPIADGEKTVNFYVEHVNGAPMLFPTPGVATFASSTQAPGRAHFTHKGRDFAVIGTKFGEVLSTFVFTEIGSVAIDQYPAVICTNGDYGDQLLISSGNNGYVYNLNTSAFTLVRTGATRMVAHLDGYGLALDADTSTLYVSDNGDFTTWDPTQFAQRSIAADPWVSMRVLESSRYVYLLGERTSEAWYDAGSASFPFAPHPSGLMQHGCAAPFSAASVGGMLFWLSQTRDGSGQVVATAGFTPDVVSTFPVSVAIGGYAVIADALGDGYHDQGHTFYVLTFPNAQATWAYDATPNTQMPAEQRWAQRDTWIAETNRSEAWRPCFHTNCFGVHLMLDRASGNILRMSSTLGSDVDGRPIRRVRRPPALVMQNRPVFVALFELLLEPGLGLAGSAQGSDPQVALRISKDGGKTFGSERLRGAGKQGEFGRRTRWFRNGSGRRWMPELVMTDPIPYRIVGALIEANAGGANASAQ